MRKWGNWQKKPLKSSNSWADKQVPGEMNVHFPGRSDQFGGVFRQKIGTQNNPSSAKARTGAIAIGAPDPNQQIQ